MKTEKLSILIITYNRENDTLDLLENINQQLNAQKLIGEILLLNNNSSDSYNQVQTFVDNSLLPVHYFNHIENLGVAKGRNFLISKAQFPLLLVLDDDVVFAEPDALQKAISLFEQPYFKENNTAVITLNIFYYSNGERQVNAFPHKQYEKYKSKSQFLTSYFIGAAHLMKKELITDTGLYPEDFFYGMEEYDLSYRIIDAGYSLGFDNSIRVLHKESPAGRVPAREKLAMMWYNKSVVAWKYLPKKYFYSTAMMWSLEYLKKSKFDIGGLIKNLRKIYTIPIRIEKQSISAKSLEYLNSVDARIYY